MGIENQDQLGVSGGGHSAASASAADFAGASCGIISGVQVKSNTGLPLGI